MTNGYDLKIQAIERNLQEGPFLGSWCKIMGATKRIVNYQKDGFYQVLSAEVGTRHTCSGPRITERRQEAMTEYAKMVLTEAFCHTIEIREKSTGKEGVTDSCAKSVELYYGADDGSDDKIVDIETFNREFEIPAVV